MAMKKYEYIVKGTSLPDGYISSSWYYYLDEGIEICSIYDNAYTFRNYQIKLIQNESKVWV